MTFAFVSSNSGGASGANSLLYNRPAGLSGGEMLVSVWAFEGVAAGSGPWIIPNIGQFAANVIGPAEGWLQACWQAPSASGVGFEVWVAINGAGATNQQANFIANENVVSVIGAWTGEYNPTGLITGGPPRVATAAQVVGNAPPAPSIVANAGELIVACGGDLMTGSGFGTPSGFTNRVDARRGAAGTVEATLADAVAAFAGTTGPITFPNAAASSTTPGVTATLAIRPAPAVVTAGGVIDAPLPEDLLVGTGYAIRVTAVDPTTGAPVSGVTIGTTVLTAESEDAGLPSDGSDLGTWQLVPGPDA